MTDPIRRTLLTAIAALPVLSLPAFAVTDAQAAGLVQQMAADIEKVINSGQPESAMYRDFERLLAKYGDMDVIARFALGPAGRTASANEMGAYTAAFRTYLARKYGQRFREFIGGSIEVKGTRADKTATIVQAVAKPRGQSPVSVDFHVSDRSGSPKVVNVVLEGINLLTTERTEITALLDQQGGSVSKLTAALKSRS